MGLDIRIDTESIRFCDLRFVVCLRRSLSTTWTLQSSQFTVSMAIAFEEIDNVTT
ncbi:hypothetical protein [Nostoc sp.]|uniref:hypothetical protein n=1 Tax=Nostoc sp. TaxID=1180 RepID=UPI002FF77F77